MTSAPADVGRTVSLEALTADPYPTYAALRRDRPVAWVPALNMWWVTRYDDVQAMLLNTDDFVTGTATVPVAGVRSAPGAFATATGQAAVAQPPSANVTVAESWCSPSGRACVSMTSS